MGGSFRRARRRDPFLTPCTIDFSCAVASGLYPRCVLVMQSQGGKSEALLDIIGERLDNAPGPTLYLVSKLSCGDR